MEKTAANFSIKYFQYLDENAKTNDDLPSLANDRDLMIDLYRNMVLVRQLDQKAVNLQRTGKMGTYPSTLGQEAVTIAIGQALKPDDILAPYYRDRGALMQRGIPLSKFLAYWGGDERGCDYGDNKDFSPAVPIATQTTHAAGAAYAIKYRKEKRAVLTCIGEGGTSEGAFYEAMNFAGVFHLPLVFVVNNNQWAISVSREQQTKTETIAQKAIAAGFEGIQVDGNDVIAMRYHVEQALNRARNGKGPFLIEAITYRLCDHTTADDFSRYYNKAEFDKAWEVEPIKRCKQFLINVHHWTEADDEKLQADCKVQVDEAVNEFLTMEPQPATAIMDYLYETLPKEYEWQREELKQMDQ